MTKQGRQIQIQELKACAGDTVPFGSNKYAYIYEDYSVEFNSYGLESFKFDSVESFVDFYFTGTLSHDISVPHYYSTLVGEREFWDNSVAEVIIFADGIMAIPDEGLDPAENGSLLWSRPLPRGENIDRINIDAEAIFYSLKTAEAA